MCEHKLSYFTNFWNLIDVGPPICIAIIMLLDWLTSKSNENARAVRYSLQAIVCLGMWFKQFYFLRLFRKTGFFINMLTRVVSMSFIFFALYILILGAFSCTFYIGTSSGDSFLHLVGETYKIGLGADDIDFDGSPAPNVMTIIYLASTLVITIVMLNLLIAVIGEAYSEVIATQDEANYFERMQLVHEISILIDKKHTEHLNKKNSYILRATVASQQQDEEDE